jgi:hypothetical protein
MVLDKLCHLWLWYKLVLRLTSKNITFLEGHLRNISNKEQFHHSSGFKEKYVWNLSQSKKNIIDPSNHIETKIEDFNKIGQWFLRNKLKCYIQIYHVWEGYLRKIPVERRKISRAEWRGKFSLKTGIFRKYPSQTWYICLITPNII